MSANKPETIPGFDPETANQPSEWAQAKLAEWESRMAQVKEEHPEFGIDLEEKWWVPLVDLEEHLDSIDQQTREKYNDWAARFVQIKYDPARLPAMREEIKVILAGYPEIGDKVDKIYFNERALTRGREYVVAEMEAGREPLPNVGAK